jgi:anti-sigma B factor antagonist
MIAPLPAVRTCTAADFARTLSPVWVKTLLSRGNGMLPDISSPLIFSSCTVRVTPGPTDVVIAIVGELDMADADKVAKILVDAADGDRATVSLELSGLTFADSSAVKAIVLGAQAAARRGVAYELVNPTARVQRLLEVTGLAGTMTIVNSD